MIFSGSMMTSITTGKKLNELKPNSFGFKSSIYNFSISRKAWDFTENAFQSNFIIIILSNNHQWPEVTSKHLMSYILSEINLTTKTYLYRGILAKFLRWCNLSSDVGRFDLHSIHRSLIYLLPRSLNQINFKASLFLK